MFQKNKGFLNVLASKKLYLLLGVAIFFAMYTAQAAFPDVYNDDYTGGNPDNSGYNVSSGYILTDELWNGLMSSINVLYTTNWKVNGNDIYYNTGNVGIGTTSPNKKLSVNGELGIGANEFPIRQTNFGYGVNWKVLQIGENDIAQRSLALNIDPSSITGSAFSGQGQILIPKDRSILAPDNAGTNWGGVLRYTSDKLYLGGSLTSGELTGNGLVVQVDGNVGIGTTNPGARLRVQQDQNGSTNIDVENGTDGTSSRASISVNNGGTAGLFFTSDTNNTQFGGLAAGKLNIMTAGNIGSINIAARASGKSINFFTGGEMSTLNQRMIIGSTGNVGIGTTSPGAKLHIETTGSNSARLFSSAAASEVFIGQSATSGNAGVIYHNATDEYTSYHIYGDSAGSALVVKKGGNIGIGTTSPSYKLEVNGDTLLSGSSAYLRIRRTGFNNWAVGTTSSGLQFYDETGAKRALYLEQNSGNVGINTNSPAGTLDVNGAICFSGDCKSSWASATGTFTISDGTTWPPADYYPQHSELTMVNTSDVVDSYTGIYFRLGSTNYSTAYIGALADGLGQYNGQLVFALRNVNGDYNLAEVARFDRAGNFGIGTTNPTSKLHVSGNIRVEGGYFYGNGNQEALRTTDEWLRLNNNLDFTNGIYTPGNLRVDGYVYVNSGGANYLSYPTGDYGSIQINGGGKNAWEGYSIDGRYVFMSDDDNSAGIYNDVDNRWIFLQERNNYVRIYEPDSSTVAMQINTAGNVGIGTTNPTQKLHVSGGNIILDNNTEYRFKDASGTDRSFAILDSSDVLRMYNNSGGNGGDMVFHTKNAAAESMRITTAGYVGINDSTPSYRLDVAGDIRATAYFRSDGDYGLYNNTDGTYFYSDDLNYFSMRSDRGLKIKNRAGTNKGYLYHNNDNAFGLLDGDGSWAFRIERDSYNSFSVNGSEKMRITTAGNVGIGNAIPDRKLAVSGTFFAGDPVAGVQISGNTIQAAPAPGEGMTSSDLNLRAYGASGLTLKSNGKMGFNTSNPRVDFHMLGSATQDPALILETVTSAGAWIGLGDSANDGWLIGEQNDQILFMRHLPGGVGSCGTGYWVDEFDCTPATGDWEYNFIMGADIIDIPTAYLLVSDDPSYQKAFVQGASGGTFFGTSGTNAANFGNSEGFATLKADGGCVYYPGGSHCPSDDRLKINIESLSNSLDKISNLQGVTFDWKEEEVLKGKPQGTQIGLIAQEVEKILPEAVNTADDDINTKSVNYEKIIPLLIESIKELKVEIDVLKNNQ